MKIFRGSKLVRVSSAYIFVGDGLTNHVRNFVSEFQIQKEKDTWLVNP